MLNGRHEQVRQLELLASRIAIAPLSRAKQRVTFRIFESETKYLLELAKLDVSAQRLEVIQGVYVVQRIAVIRLRENLSLRTLSKRAM